MYFIDSLHTSDLTVVQQYIGTLHKEDKSQYAIAGKAGSSQSATGKLIRRKNCSRKKKSTNNRENHRLEMR